MNTTLNGSSRVRPFPAPKVIPKPAARKPEIRFHCRHFDAALGSPWKPATTCSEDRVPLVVSGGTVALADVEGTHHHHLGPQATGPQRHAALKHFRSRHDGMRKHVGAIPLLVYGIPNVGATSLDGPIAKQDAVHEHWRWIMDEIEDRPEGPVSIVYPCAVLYDRYGQEIPQEGAALADEAIERKTMRTRALCAKEVAARRGTPWAAVVWHRQKAVACPGTGGRSLVEREIGIVCDVLAEFRPDHVYFWNDDPSNIVYLQVRQTWMSEQQREAVVREWRESGEWFDDIDETRHVACKRRSAFARRIVDAL